MSKFTPGPWVAQPLGIDYDDDGAMEFCYHAEVTCAASKTICALSYDGRAFAQFEQELEANLALIAAAPEMFEACEAVLSCKCSKVPCDLCDAKLKYAIAKAKGERK